jgi:hypothetical protein
MAVGNGNALAAASSPSTSPMRPSHQWHMAQVRCPCTPPAPSTSSAERLWRLHAHASVSCMPSAGTEASPRCRPLVLPPPPPPTITSFSWAISSASTLYTGRAGTRSSIPFGGSAQGGAAPHETSTRDAASGADAMSDCFGLCALPSCRAVTHARLGANAAMTGVAAEGACRCRQTRGERWSTRTP